MIVITKVFPQLHQQHLLYRLRIWVFHRPFYYQPFNKGPIGNIPHRFKDLQYPSYCNSQRHSNSRRQGMLVRYRRQRLLEPFGVRHQRGMGKRLVTYYH